MSSQYRKGDFLSRYLILVLLALAITMAMHTRALRALEPATACADKRGQWLTASVATPSNNNNARCVQGLTKAEPRLLSSHPDSS